MALPLAGLVTAFGAGAKGVAGAGLRGMIGAGVRTAGQYAVGKAGEKIKSAFAGGKKQEENQEIIPTNVSVVEGFAEAVKGATTSGGGGGALVKAGGSALVSSPAGSLVSKTGDPVVDRLEEIKKLLQRLIGIETENRERVRQQVLDFARESEKKSKSDEESAQEASKVKPKKQDENPIVKAGKKTFGGIIDFIKELVGEFIQYKILDWLSNPENKKYIQGTIQFFMNAFKFFGFIYDRFIKPYNKLMMEILGGSLNLFFDVVKAVTDLLTLKWLTNPKEFIDSIIQIPKTIIEMVPNILGALLNFITFGFFDGAKEAITSGIQSALGMVPSEKPEGEQNGGETTTPQPTKQEGFNPAKAVGGAIKGIGNAVGTAFNNSPIGLAMNSPFGKFMGNMIGNTPIGMVGKFVGGMVGGKKDDETPQLREGGIVGPDAKKNNKEVTVKPLKDLADFVGIGSKLKKTTKLFMKLLTLPFKLIGAALIALVLNTVGRIPGVKMFLKPILDNIISAFDLPPSLATIVKNVGFTLKRPSKKKTEQPSPKETGPAPGSAASSIDQSSPSAAAAGKEGAGSVDMQQPGATANMQAGQASQTSGKFSSKAEDRKGGEVPFRGPDGKEYKVVINATNGHYEVWDRYPMLWSKPYDLEDNKNLELKQKAFNQVRAYFVNNAPAKGIDLKYITGQDVKNKQALEEESKKDKLQEKSVGGWITGPQTGYPVSLDGGSSVSFIGHGTEWVGFKKASGGNVSSAFVIPYDTPSTRSNGGLTERRFNEAKRGGYDLPGYSMGGKVKEDKKRGSGDDGLKTKTSGGVVVTSRYGMRWGRWHAGTDLAGVPIGTPIKSLTGGKVLYASSYSGYGNTVDLQVKNGKIFRFAHLDGFAVKTGQVVPAGGLIGTLGNTGVGTGPHLHFEHRTKQDFGKGSSMDPEKTGALSEILVGGKPISGIKPGDTSSSNDETMTTTTGATSSTSPAEATPMISDDDLKYLYEALTGKSSSVEAKPSTTDTSKFLTNVPNLTSTAFTAVQKENLANVPFSSAPNMSIVDMGNSVQSSFSSGIDSQELGSTLPRDGNWSIYKTNL